MASSSLLILSFCILYGGDTSTRKEASKEEPKQYKLRRKARIRGHPYKVNNMLILMKKFNKLSLEDVYISKAIEDMKRSKPMNPLNP